MANRKKETLRDHPPGEVVHRDRSDEREIAEQSEAGAGHPIGGRDIDVGEDRLPYPMPSYDTNPEHWQHTRKGQAQSPRELNHNEPEKKREGHR